MDRIKLYKEAFKKYGEQLQIIMFMEELSELIQRLSKRIRHPKSNIIQITEEMADVQNMIDQFKYTWGIEKQMDEVKIKKLFRLKRRLKRIK